MRVEFWKKGIQGPHVLVGRRLCDYKYFMGHCYGSGEGEWECKTHIFSENGRGMEFWIWRKDQTEKLWQKTLNEKPTAVQSNALSWDVGGADQSWKKIRWLRHMCGQKTRRIGMQKAQKNGSCDCGSWGSKIVTKSKWKRCYVIRVWIAVSEIWARAHMGAASTSKARGDPITILVGKGSWS